jgi:hypothetical protein
MTSQPDNLLAQLLENLRAGRDPNKANLFTLLMYLTSDDGWLARLDADDRALLAQMLRGVVHRWLADDTLLGHEDTVADMRRCGFTDAEIGLTPGRRRWLDQAARLRDDEYVTTLRRSADQADAHNFTMLRVLAERIAQGRTTLAELGTTAGELQACYNRTMRALLPRLRALDPEALEAWWYETVGPGDHGYHRLIQPATIATAATLGLGQAEFTELTALAERATNALTEVNLLLYDASPSGRNTPKSQPLI